MIPVGKPLIAPLLTRQTGDATSTTKADDAKAVANAGETTATATTPSPATTSATTPTTNEKLKLTAETIGQAVLSSTAPAKNRPAFELRDPIAAHRIQLKADLKVALTTLRTLPPALTFFGGARIKESDPYYKISQEIGRLLAERGVPPRTGAGPGIMKSVPEGYVLRRKELEANGESHGPQGQLRLIEGLGDEASLDDVRTQGFNIKLPHEQKLNPVIEVAKEIQLFPFRKLALYENARGVVTFPGGFGTLDELFEIWTLASKGKLSDPLAAVGVDFWKPTMEALQKVAVTDRALISQHDFDRLFVTDDPHALLDHMLPTTKTSTPALGFEQDPQTLEETLLKEVDLATQGMKTLRPAVAFLGGESLQPGDKALDVAKGLAAVVAGHGVAVRVGDEGSGSRAVVDAAEAAGASKKNIQNIVWTGATSTTTPPTSTTPTTPTSRSMPTSTSTSTSTTTTTFSERIPHKELLLRGAEAYVVLPAGLKGLDEMATVLCQMQTGKMPKRPLVLVGSDYWTPILAAWKETMVSKDRMLIAPEDMELFTVVDSVEAAQQALTNLR